MSDVVDKSENGLVLSTDYAIKKLVLYTSDGNSVDIRNLMVELDIYEDIFSPFMSGNIIVDDGRDLINKFSIHGNEFIEIEIDKPSLELPISKIFRIYKISDRRIMGNKQRYTMHFCSEEAILSSQSLISKSYKGLKISAIVDNILRNDLSVKSNKINFLEETEKSYDLIIPRMSPFEAIMWLTNKTHTTDKHLFLFFQSRGGYNFISYKTLIEQEPYLTYSTNPKVSSDVGENSKSFTFIEVQKDFDLFNSTRYGAYSAGALTLDIISKQLKPYSYTISDTIENKQLLNGFFPINDLLNRSNKTQLDTYDNMLKYFVNKDSDGGNPLYSAENSIKAAAKLAQLNSFRMIGTVPGDVLLAAGTVINVDMRSVIPQDQNADQNTYRTGKYLISSSHHKFNRNGVYVTVMELLSDSMSAQLPSAVNTSTSIRELVQS